MPCFRMSPALAAALFCLPALAGASGMEPVLVTATRTAVPAAELSASVEVITREELERLPAADIADVLRLRAGVEIARAGGPGQQTSVFLRGTESNHVLVLIDGMRINPGTIGTAAVQNIAPGMIERIEVVKGPRSTLYGSDAIGGVINVITRRGAAMGPRVELGTGSFDTQTASLSAGASGARGELSLAGYLIDSAGFPTRQGDDTDRGYRNLSLSAAATTTVGPAKLGLRGWHASGTSEYSDFFVTPVDQDFENSAVALEIGGEPTDVWRTRATLGHAVDTIRQNQSPDRLRTRRWQLDWQNDLSLGTHHALTTGVLLQREQAESESFGLGFDRSTGMRLAYLQDQIVIGPHRLLLAGGYTDHETFGGHATWNVEYAVQARPSTSLWLAAGSAFRAPDATDRFGFGGNEGLAPESSRSLEMGLRHRAGQRHNFSLVAFRTEIDQLIQYVVTDFATFAGENRNVDRARIDGIELAWRYAEGPWQARAAVTLQDPRDLATDTRLLRRASQNLTLALSRSFGPHLLALDVLTAGERRDVGFPSAVSLDAYVVANLSARVALADHWTLTARFENLLDEQYELAQGYNTMDRSAFVALRYDFR